MKRNNKPGSHWIEFFCSLENALSPCVYCPLLNGVSNEESKWMNILDRVRLVVS